RGPGDPRHAGPGSLRRLGLAGAFPDFRAAAGDLGLDPPAPARIPRLHTHEERRPGLTRTHQGSIRTVAQPAPDPAGPDRPDGRPGRGLVHRPVLRPVFPD